MERSTRAALTATTVLLVGAFLIACGAAEEGEYAPRATPIVDGDPGPVDALPGAVATPPPPLDLEVRITSRDATHYEIDDDVLILALLGGIIGEVRAALQPGGGYALDGIVPGSLFARLGLGNGDIVHVVNGVTLTAPGSLKAAYAEMRTSRALEVVLERGGARLTVHYDLTAAPDPMSSAFVRESLHAGDDPGVALTPAELDAGIRKIDATSWEIDRALVDKLAASPTSWMSSVRVVPSLKDGEMRGFKLFAIRPSSVAYKLGFQNGDVVEAIDGAALRAPGDLLSKLASLGEAKAVSVSIVRRAKPMVLRYRFKE